MSLPLLSVTVSREHDVVGGRQRARQLAALLGFDLQDQTRIATAVSEIARNAVGYGGGGRIDFSVEGQTRPQIFTIRVWDRGPGIADLDTILSGRYQSSTGMGLGIIGAKRLMDAFDIDSAPGRGTSVILRKLMPRRADMVTPAAAARIADSLAKRTPRDAVEEVQQQNQELLRMLSSNDAFLRWQAVVFAALIVLVVLFLPRGVLQFVQSRARAGWLLPRHSAGRPPIVVPTRSATK